MRLLSILVLCAAALAAESLTGKWDFVWETPGGERRSTLVFKEEGGKLEVLMPDNKAALKGTVADGKFEVKGSSYSPEAGQAAEMRISGTLEAGKLKGDGNWAEHGLSFTATRAK